LYILVKAILPFQNQPLSSNPILASFEFSSIGPVPAEEVNMLEPFT
jgi:hypothetical protein